jgi:GDPmannose 4,6-dehydratase
MGEAKQPNERKTPSASANSGKTALITGITGQDGSYLADLLLDNGYEVHGLVRRASTSNTANIAHIEDRLNLHFGDVSDSDTIRNIIDKAQPDEIYNFAAMSQVRISYDLPVFTGDITGLGFARLLEVVRQSCPQTKIYQACSSEMFGKVQEIPQKETTPFYPRSPYGCAKAFAFYLGRAYREGYGMRIYNGILFNHESPRRGDQFVSKKIARAVARIKCGLQSDVTLGNLDAARDWGFAKDYVYWIWRMVQGEPDDFIIATGETHTVEEFVHEAFAHVGLRWQDHVRFDDSLKRPAEVDYLQGDPSKAIRVLGYEVRTRFAELVRLMVDHELTCTAALGRAA